MELCIVLRLLVATHHFAPSESTMTLNPSNMAKSLGALDETIEPIEVSQLDVLSKDHLIGYCMRLEFQLFCFKTRSKLSSYLKSVHESLNSDGRHLDCFGGAQCQYSNEEEIEQRPQF